MTLRIFYDKMKATLPARLDGWRFCFVKHRSKRMNWITENIGLVLVVVSGGLFVLGLVLGLKSEDGRRRLAEAAVRFAVTALALAERWLGAKFDPVTLEDGRTVYKDNQVTLARVQLKAWLKRAGDG